MCSPKLGLHGHGKTSKTIKKVKTDKSIKKAKAKGIKKEKQKAEKMHEAETFFLMNEDVLN